MNAQLHEFRSHIQVYEGLTDLVPPDQISETKVEAPLPGSLFAMSHRNALSRAHRDAEQVVLKTLEDRLEEALTWQRQAHSTADAAARMLEDSTTAVHTAHAAIAAFKLSCVLLRPPRPLPLELLGEIIKAWAASDKQTVRNRGAALAPAFAAASVCRRWRAAALSVSSIWASVFINFERIEHDDVNDYLKLVLSRSRTARLRVDLAAVPTFVDFSHLDDSDTHFIRVLAQAGHLRITFAGDTANNGLTFAQSILHYLQASMPHLESVDFLGTPMLHRITFDEGARILTLAPNLKKIVVKNLDLFPALTLRTLPHVEVFEFTGELPLSSVRRLASAWPKLRTLAVSSTASGSSGGNGLLKLPALETLRTLCGHTMLQLMSPKCAPRLRRVGLRWSHSALDQFTHFIAADGPAPSPITDLELTLGPAQPRGGYIEDMYPDWRSMAFFAQLPNLLSLTLTNINYGHLVDVLLRGCSSAELPSLEKITLKQCCVDRTGIQALLKFLTLRQAAASAARTKIRTVVIRQDKMTNTHATFPAWLKPQLERLVPEVDFPPFVPAPDPEEH